MRLLAFGDSFVLGQGDPERAGWVGRALSGRGDITLYNLGVRGHTTADIAARWRAEAQARIVAEEPARIVFSFGANDCSSRDGAPRVAAAQSLLNARTVLTLAASLAPVLLVGPPPVPEPGMAARLEALNEHLKALSARLQIPFIDVFRPLAADGLWIADAMAGDGIHPGAKGYERLAELVSVHPAWRSFTRGE